jgi:hypothetical protein
MGAAGDVKIGRHIDQAIANAATVPEIAARANQAVKERNFAGYQLDSAKTDITPLRYDTLASEIQRIASGDRAMGNADTRNAMAAVDKELAAIANPDGTINAARLHEFQINGINPVIQKGLGGENIPKSRTAPIIAIVRNLLDKSISAAGGPEWETSFKKAYREGKDQLREMDIGKRLGESLNSQFNKDIASTTSKETPASYLTTFNNIQKETDDYGRPVINALSNENRSKAQNVANQLERNQSISELASKGFPSTLEQLRHNEAPKVSGPGLISAKISTYNWIMRGLEGKGGKVTDEMLATIMHDPQMLAKVLKDAKPEAKMDITRRITARLNPQAPIAPTVPQALSTLSAYGVDRKK